MGTRTTTAGKVKLGLALDPHAYELLQQMASGPRGLGSLLDELICAEAARRSDPPPPTARLLEDVQNSRRQLQTLSRRLVEVQEDERRSLSRDLHDTSAQNITALKLGLGNLARSHECTQRTRDAIDGLQKLADTVAEDLHRLAVNLRPVALDRYGLLPALEQLLTEFRKHAAVDVAFHAGGADRFPARLPADIETALYRIAQESLTNVTRYAHAANVSVMLTRDCDRVQLVVEDDGLGFDVEAALRRGRLGLLGMRERAGMFGGTLEIESRPGHGTTIVAEIPLAQAEAGADLATGPGAVRPEAAWSGRSSAAGAGPLDARLVEAAELARAKVLGDALIEMTTDMARCTNADEILKLVLAHSAEALGREVGHIILREDGGWRLAYRAPEARPSGRRVTDAEAPAWVRAERTRQVLVVDDTAAAGLDDELRAPDYGIRSYACVPLLAGARCTGILTFINYSAAVPFHPSEVEFLNRLATLASLALENALLHESEARQRDEMARRLEELQAVLEAYPAGIGIAEDPLCKVIRANSVLANLLGMPSGANISLSADSDNREATYRVVDDQGRDVPPDRLPMQRAAAGEIVRDIATHVVAADGRKLTLLTTAVPLHGQDGTLRGAVSALVDITERVALEERLREAEANARDLIRYAPAAIYEVDYQTGRFLRVNDTMCEITGYSRDELLAMTAFDIVDEASRSRLARRRDNALAGEDVPAAVEFEIKHKDGHLISAVVNSRVVHADGQPVRAHVIAYDVTQRRRVLGELQEQRERLGRLAAQQEAVLDSIADGLVIYDQDGQIVRMNGAAHRHLGYAPDKPLPALGQLAHGMHLRRPDGAPYPPGDYPARRALRGETVQGDVMVLDREDKTAWVSASAAPVVDQEGRLIGAVATFSDITPLHDAQQRLQAAYEELQSQTEELQSQSDELRTQAQALTAANAGLLQERNRLRALEAHMRDQQEQSERLAAELDAILSSIAHGMVVYDADGRIMRMNGAAEDLLGFSEEVRRLPYDQRVPSAAIGLHADGRPYARYEYPTVRALQGEVVRNEELIMHLPGRPDAQSWVSVSSGPIRRADGSLAGAVTTFTGVNELHRLNAELAAANAELEAILTAVPSGLIVYDARGTTVRASQAARRMSGWSADTWQRPASERVMTDVQFQDREGRPLAKAAYPAMCALRGETLDGEEYHVHFPDSPDRDMWAVFAAGPVLDAGGRLTGALITWTETSELHEANWQLTRANALLEAQAEELRQAAELLEARVRERTAELEKAKERLELLHEIDSAILAERTPSQIAQAALGKVLELAHAERAAAILFDPPSDTGEILAAAGHDLPEARAGTRIPLLPYPAIDKAWADGVVTVEDIAALPDEWAGKDAVLQLGMRSGVVVPLRAGDEMIGCLTVFRNELGALPEEALALITQVADSLALAVANTRLHEQLETSSKELHALSRRLVERQELERSYVADRLYNEAAQVIAALKLQAGMLGRSARGEPVPAGWLDDLSAKMDRALAELHRLASDLRPAVLDRLGLAAAVQQYTGELAAAGGMSVDCVIHGLQGVRLPAETETAVYRVMQAALENVSRHSQATCVEVDLRRTERKVVLQVADNGVGFDVQAALKRGALGLVGMRERAAALAGSLEIESAPGAGTSVILTVPADHESLTAGRHRS